MDSANPPVLVIGFRRSAEIKQVITSLRKLQPNKVYLAMDGPRHQSEVSLTEQARCVAIQAIDWKCDLKTNFADSNCGCAEFVIKAITWFFQNEDYGIILEDDILIHEKFFEFVKVYSSYPGFSCLCACTFELALHKNSKVCLTDPFLSKIPSIWGWSTRRDVWQHFLRFNRSSNPVINFIALARRIGFWQSLLFSMCLNYIDAGLMDAWDYEFAFFMITSDRLSVFPPVQLSSNIGNSPLASNCSSDLFLTESLRTDANFDFLPLDSIRINFNYMNHQAMNTLMKYSYKVQSLKHLAKIIFESLLSRPKK